MSKRWSILVVQLFYLALAASAISAQGQEIGSEASQKQILSIYLDHTGKALVSGYANSLEGLSFLNRSEYSYENDTGQLYAITNALTTKEGDAWTIIFEADGYFEDYHLTFFLPTDFRIKNISGSTGLEYLLFASNDSLALDFQGYEIRDPVARIEYQQPLKASMPQKARPSSLLPILLFLSLAAVAIILWRYKAGWPQTAAVPSAVDADKQNYNVQRSPLQKEYNDPDFQVAEGLSSNLKAAREEFKDLSVPEEILHCEEEAPSESDGIKLAEKQAIEDDRLLSKPPGEGIEISREMAAVMETLTAKERAVLQALIDRGGRSTQADLRYQTQTPKSSLSGIIYSLERRRLVTKKEWGRTNVIELSDWFLSKKESL